jgi:hypothetical protein
MEFCAATVHTRTAYTNTGILKARLWLGDRDRVFLAIASFIIHYLGDKPNGFWVTWRRSRFFGHLPRTLIDLNSAMSASACYR